MFLPKEYVEPDLETQKQLIRDFPLGTVVTAGGPNGLNANHFPFVIREDPEKPDTFFLIGHFHKENPAAKDLQAAADSGDEILIVFQGYNRYCTPSWYPTKAESHKVAPTWLYSAVHVYGKPKLVNFKEDNATLHGILKQQASTYEESRPKPWDVDEAPEGYLNILKNMIFGLIIEVTRTEGKWKLNQKQKKVDVQGTADGLQEEAQERPASGKMAEDVHEFHEKYLQRLKY
ncbi:uncharacterized protein SAPINGB_P001361 [Magnusiomyces paraingens]|uniref:Transcriptional regulator n=1 Tax=Magnusiomyces paraingens TaxID=2606893 RepID=A0A5E8BBH8_9ASCO|nr:uncharacterized protein SAPINGB_P001361 [Saprochaete ingens]VVT46736.1 unnamed protein product [Saprochaete ingens]